MTSSSSGKPSSQVSVGPKSPEQVTLTLRPRANGAEGWELADAAGVAVGRMSTKFQPPAGRIVAVRVAAILVRHARENEQQDLRCMAWELVLPEIEYVPE